MPDTEHKTTGWQSVETAPRNREVLIADKVGEVCTAIWRNGRWLASHGGSPCFPDDFSDGEYDLAFEEVCPVAWQDKPEPPHG